MPQIEDVKVLNIDNVPYAVDSMSDQVKQLVAIYNEWNQKEADARNEFMLVQAAKNDLSRQIIQQVRAEKAEEAAKAEEAEGEAPAPEVAAVNTTEAPAEETVAVTGDDEAPAE